MFKIKNPGKKIKSVLAELGSDYEIKVVDGEQCIYRNLGNGYDIEISGLNNAKLDFKATVYVWKITDGTQIKETITDITSVGSLKNVLNDVVTKYS